MKFAWVLFGVALGAAIGYLLIGKIEGVGCCSFMGGGATLLILHPNW